MTVAKTLFIMNDSPYGTERTYNALRLAGALSKREGRETRVFLIGDAAAAAKRSQHVPSGCYNVETFATTASVSSGSPGGVFTPSLFLGAALGGTVGHALVAVMPLGAVGPAGGYALVGMAALAAATTHAPVLAAVMVFGSDLVRCIQVGRLS